VRQQSQVALGPAEAFAALALIAVAADGYLAESEAQVLNAALSRMHLFRSYSGDVMASMYDRLLGILRRQGSNALFNLAVETLPHDLYNTAFAIVTDIVLADGEISSEEEKLLNDLYHALDLSEDIAVKIIDVMLIKNKG
jgi:hypothetical protein